MRIYIPTYGRADRQVTYEELPKKLQSQTTLVVQAREIAQYKKYKNLAILPQSIQTITPTRQWIAHMHHNIKRDGPYLVMLDDDLRFDKRRKDDRGKFLHAQPQQITELFNEIERYLKKGYAHVGVLAREGGNRVTEKVLEATRMMRVLAYDVRVLRKEEVKFDRLPLQEDFDVTLQLLRKGYPNAVLCDWVQGQGSSNAPGGCSTYRTLKMHEANCYRLAEYHKGFVTCVEKETKGAWNGAKRIDVIVQWKKAYESSSCIRVA